MSGQFSTNKLNNTNNNNNNNHIKIHTIMRALVCVSIPNGVWNWASKMSVSLPPWRTVALKTTLESHLQNQPQIIKVKLLKFSSKVRASTLYDTRTHAHKDSRRSSNNWNQMRRRSVGKCTEQPLSLFVYVFVGVCVCDTFCTCRAALAHGQGLCWNMKLKPFIEMLATRVKIFKQTISFRLYFQLPALSFVICHLFINTYLTVVYAMRVLLLLLLQWIS